MHHVATPSDSSASVPYQSGSTRRISGRIRRRIQSLYGSISRWTGGPTAELVAQMSFFAELIEELKPRVAALTGITIE